MRTIFIFLCLFCLFFQNVLAQSHYKKDSTKYDLHLASTVILTGGNLERVVSQNRLWGEIGNNTIQFVTENSYRYGKNFSRIVENDILTRNYVRFFPNKKFYGFVLGVYEDNFKRSIEKRWQLGGGGSYNFFKKKKDFLKTSLAMVFEHSKYKDSIFNITHYNGSFTAEEIRGIIRFGGVHTISSNHLIFRHDTWFMQGLRNSQNYRWHSLVGLQVPIYKVLSFKTDFDYTYESLTIAGKNPFGNQSSKFDWVLSFGLSYDFNNKK